MSAASSPALKCPALEELAATLSFMPRRGNSATAMPRPPPTARWGIFVGLGAQPALTRTSRICEAGRFRSGTPPPQTIQNRGGRGRKRRERGQR